MPRYPLRRTKIQSRGSNTSQKGHRFRSSGAPRLKQDRVSAARNRRTERLWQAPFVSDSHRPWACRDLAPLTNVSSPRLECSVTIVRKIRIDRTGTSQPKENPSTSAFGHRGGGFLIVASPQVRFGMVPTFGKRNDVVDVMQLGIEPFAFQVTGDHRPPHFARNAAVEFRWTHKHECSRHSHKHTEDRSVPHTVAVAWNNSDAHQDAANVHGYALKFNPDYLTLSTGNLHP